MISKNTFSVRGNRVALLIVSGMAALAFSLALGATAQANFTFDDYGFQVTEAPTQKLDESGNPVLENGFIINNTAGTFEEFNFPVYNQIGAFDRQAGSHPDFTFGFSVPIDPNVVVEGHTSPGPAEAVHAVDVDLPPGMIGNPSGIATCDPRDLATPGVGQARCPLASQVGVAEIESAGISGPGLARAGVYNIAHGPEVPALFGLNYLGNVAYIQARVRPSDYGISSGSFGISQGLAITRVKLTLWGVPADPSHDGDREGNHDINGPAIHAPDLPLIPFLSAPTFCSDTPDSFTVRGDSWQSRGIFDEHTTTTDSEGTPFVFEGCEKLPFAPTVDVEPSTHATDTPTGLSVDLQIPQSKEPNGLATAHLRNVKMTLPKGVTVSSSSAAGLGSCSPAQIGLGSNDAPACPSSSKIGTVKLDTPLLAEQLQGDVFIAKQNDNPFNSLLAMYIAIKGPGFYVKIAGKVTPDPQTGQLTVTFADNPQQPFERLQLDLNTGPRAPLATPSQCGTYNAETELTPWSGTAPVVLSTPIVVNQGCATGGFAPHLEAGTVDSSGGSFSPFILRITRGDGESNLSRIQATLPEGLLAKLAGVPLCSDAVATTGDCPAGSQVGKVVVGSGAGPQPLYVPEAGKAPTAAYLAGPYKGAPYSLVVKVPAQAGPFDLGTVTVRNGLYIDPTTAQVTAKSDALPQILQGIPIAYRDVRVEVDRPDFTINPTDCSAQKVTSTLTSATGQTATPSTPFSASGCKELGFGPSLKISLKGKMKRTGNPALTAVLEAPKGDANLAKTTVILPKSEFIDNEHINNPCTRVQFNADACPASSILGTATATSPLLDKPVSGPVYFRSNGGERELPDLVADLNGPIHVTVVGFIDSVKGSVRTRFANIPDAPVSKFTLKMKGGAKGLLANSRNLCSFTPRAKVQMTGQNGKTANSSLKLATSCGKAKRSK
ncbi:MAG TPA: hypothetical protein VLK37_06960 [Solirubrobacterales bacterium]|nr:hypothetical protein [Solirubrobacterales bacterium]